MVVVSGVMDRFGCDPFPEMVSNSRCIEAEVPMLSRSEFPAEMASLEVPFAVLVALEAHGFLDLASLAQLSEAHYGRMGVPPRHRDVLIEARRPLHLRPSPRAPHPPPRRATALDPK